MTVQRHRLHHVSSATTLQPVSSISLQEAMAFKWPAEPVRQPKHGLQADTAALARPLETYMLPHLSARAISNLRGACSTLHQLLTVHQSRV